MGQTPIANMGELISDQRIWSSGVNLPDEMSGLFLRHTSIGMAILVNLTMFRGRKRFSYAHGTPMPYSTGIRTATVSTRDNASELIEKRANAFAAALLMPGEGVTEFLRSLDKGLPSRYEQTIFDVATEGRIDTQTRPIPGSQAITHQDAAMLAHHFGVSYQATTYRLRA
ncbi:MAG: ImmA/IrrE family metallo-endopeptidase [Bdellovibrionales bacterium]|nr:ImmA/IrrE family metallo-endopeptidase [Bdellovibrionales bacterium]